MKTKQMSTKTTNPSTSKNTKNKPLTNPKNTKSISKQPKQTNEQISNKKDNLPQDISLFKKQLLNYIKENKKIIINILNNSVEEKYFNNPYFSYTQYIWNLLEYENPDYEFHMGFNYDTNFVVYKSDITFNINIDVVKEFAQQYGYNEGEIINDFYNKKYRLEDMLNKLVSQIQIEINSENKFICEKEIKFRFETDIDALISFIEKNEEFIIRLKKILEEKKYLLLTTQILHPHYIILVNTPL